MNLYGVEGKYKFAISKPKYSGSRYNEREHVEQMPKSGILRKTTFWMDMRIKTVSQRDPWLPGPRIIAEIPELVSALTV